MNELNEKSRKNSLHYEFCSIGYEKRDAIASTEKVCRIDYIMIILTLMELIPFLL